MKKKPVLGFWQIWNMSFGFLGIQFGFALQNANVSRIFQSLGGDVDRLAVYWLAAPVTGLIVQPIIGHYSDRTWGKLGRRRPYFLAGAVLASLALLLMPNSPVLWVAVGTLWIMDASVNISMEPFRAFVGDMLPSEQRTLGFAMQSFFIGTGAVVASFLPYILTNWFDVPNVAEAGKLIPLSVKLSFYIGGSVFFLAVLWTVLRTREYSPEELRSFAQDQPDEIRSSPVTGAMETGRKEKFVRGGSLFLIAGLALSWLLYAFRLEKELFILSGGVAVFGVVQLLTAQVIHRGKTGNGFVVIVMDIFSMPKAMIQLAVVQFFSWFALFAMWIYTTPAVTSHIYGTSDTGSALYNEGANWVGVLFGSYNGFAAILAFLLPLLARHTSRKATHALSLVMGGIGLASFYVIRDPGLLILSMAGVGIAWASILSMPYAILTGSLPAEKMGTYMGIFNFFIVIPQIMAASILGFMINRLFHGEAIMALVVGGISMALAAVSVLFVDDVEK